MTWTKLPQLQDKTSLLALPCFEFRSGSKTTVAGQEKKMTSMMSSTHETGVNYSPGPMVSSRAQREIVSFG